MSEIAPMLYDKTMRLGVSTEEYLSLERNTLYAINISSGRKMLIDTYVSMITTSSYIKENMWCFVEDPGFNKLIGKKPEPEHFTIWKDAEPFVGVEYDERRDRILAITTTSVYYYNLSSKERDGLRHLTIKPLFRWFPTIGNLVSLQVGANISVMDDNGTTYQLNY